ncbi:MAG: GNAT family N-acetyltransferase [Proteobacteria bacterium]|nr:GNAT family N-acetyltransferase [Pseudomonadota bacterium]
MTPTLRSPIPSNYATIASWIPDAAACARWAGPLLRFPFSPAELPDLLGGDTATSYSMVGDSPELLGFGQLVKPEQSVLRLARIIVAPDKRGLGLGACLCRLLLTEASSYTGVERLTLGVYRDNPAAIALYSKLGFAERAPHPRPEIMSMERVIDRG